MATEILGSIMFPPLGFLRLSGEGLPGASVPLLHYSLDLVTVPHLRLIGISSISYLPPEISTFPNQDNPESFWVKHFSYSSSLHFRTAFVFFYA